MLATDLAFETDGAEVNPTLPGKVGGATVTINP
jgi:hypothetical protein